jgi:hypothetical protein
MRASLLSVTLHSQYFERTALTVSPKLGVLQKLQQISRLFSFLDAGEIEHDSTMKA